MILTEALQYRLAAEEQGGAPPVDGATIGTSTLIARGIWSERTPWAGTAWAVAASPTPMPGSPL